MKMFGNSVNQSKGDNREIKKDFDHCYGDFEPCVGCWFYPGPKILLVALWNYP
jgi:hypothetical protein